MGWNAQIDEELKRQQDQERKEARLVAHARKLGIDVGKYYFGTGARRKLNVRNLQWNVDEEEKKRQKKSKETDTKKAADHKKSEFDSAMPPEGLSPQGQQQWLEAPDEKTRRDIESAARYKAPEPDPFGNAEYDKGDFGQLDEYAMDFADDEGLSRQQYQKKLLFQDNVGVTVHDYQHGDGTSTHQVAKAPFSIREYAAKARNMEPDELEALQRDLYAAGFYGTVVGRKDEKPIWGAADKATVDAMALLGLTTMRRKNSTIVDTLEFYRKRVDVNGDGKPDAEEADKPKPVITLTNQTDLDAAAQSQAVDLMGRRLDDSQVGAATGGYNAAEAAYQQASQQAQIDNKAGTFTAPASASAYAEANIRNQYAPEVDSYGYLSIVNALMQKLGLAG